MANRRTAARRRRPPLQFEIAPTGLKSEYNVDAVYDTPGIATCALAHLPRRQDQARFEKEQSARWRTTSTATPVYLAHNSVNLEVTMKVLAERPLPRHPRARAEAGARRPLSRRVRPESHALRSASREASYIEGVAPARLGTRAGA